MKCNEIFCMNRCNFFWQLNARFCVVTVELVLDRINVAAHQDMEEHSVKKVHYKLKFLKI